MPANPPNNCQGRPFVTELIDPSSLTTTLKYAAFVSLSGGNITINTTAVPRPMAFTLLIRSADQQSGEFIDKPILIRVVAATNLTIPLSDIYTC